MGDIAGFLRGKTIFITGATGFLGKPLVAKILTEAPDVDKIYLLIRSKKGYDAQQRLVSEVFNSNVFGNLRRMHGSDFDQFVTAKVIGVSGDISQPNLGIEPEIYASLSAEVGIIINSAAVVIFDERLDEAFNMNTFSPLKLLKFAKECNQVLFLHVSTAYVSGDRNGDIPEEISNHKNIDQLDVDKEYAQILEETLKVETESIHPKVLGRFRREASGRSSDSKKIESLVDAARERWVRRRLIDYGMKRVKAYGWNDCYTFTKALAERMIMKHRDGLPTVILRPSIIESSMSEPEPGWIDGLRMADPLIVGYGKGRLSDFPADPKIILDLTPVDFVVNALLASLMKMDKEGGVKIYQVATGSRNPLSFSSLYDLTRDYFLHHPMLNKKGDPVSLPNWRFPSKERFELVYKLKYLFPLGLASRVIEMLPSSKRMNKYKRRVHVLKTTIERILYYESIYGPYANLDCRFETANTEKLFSELSQEDKSRFNFDISKINWKSYIQDVHIPGLKRNILKIDVPTLEKTPSIAETEALEHTIESFENLLQLLRSTAMRFPDKVALQMKRQGQWVRFSYFQFYKLVLAIASGLEKAGFKKGDKAILYSENQPEWGITYFAAASIGVILVPIDSQTPTLEVMSLASFVEAKGIFASKGNLSKVENGKREIRVFDINDLCLQAMSEMEDVDEGGGELIDPIQPDDEDLEGDSKVTESIGLDDVASIIFTSGTLVEPRGAILSHRNFISDFLSVSQVLRPLETDQFLSILPLYHSFGFTCGLLMAIYGGSTITYVDTLKPNVLLNMMDETGATCLLGMPRLFRLVHGVAVRSLAKEEGIVPDSDLAANRIRQMFGGKMRVLVSGGAHLDHDVYETFQNLDMPIYEGYGLTECAPVLTVNPPVKTKIGSAGPPVPGVEIKISHRDGKGNHSRLDPDSRLLIQELSGLQGTSADEIMSRTGEITVRGPNVMSGYYNNPPITEKALKDGWLYTGDLGYLDEDGYLYIIGREKNVIVSGAGKNVYPEELEVIYKDRAEIDEICVLGVKGQGTWGEDVHAIIVPKKKGSAEVEASIRGHVGDIGKRVPSYQRIQKIHIWDEELPKDENSKLERKLIKETLVGRLQKDIPKIPIFEEPKIEDLDQGKVESWEEEVILRLSKAADMPVEKIGLDSDLDNDLGLDSLAKVELLLLLEERIEGSLPDSVVESIKTVRDVVEFDKIKVTAAESGENAWPEIDLKPHLEAKIFRGFMNVVSKLYFQFSRDGLENIPREGVYLIASSHSSHLDTLAIIVALGKKAEKLLVGVAVDYFFENASIKSWFVSNFLNGIPLERRGSSVQGVRISQQVLSEGRSLLIFPEGGRSVDGELQPFKYGIGLLAYELGVPIIPTRVSGTYEAWPKGKNFPRRGSVKVRFGEPIDPKVVKIGIESKYEAYKEIVDRVRSSIEDLKKDERIKHKE